MEGLSLEKRRKERKRSQVDDALLHTYPRREKVVRRATTPLHENADPRVPAPITTTAQNKMNRGCCSSRSTPFNGDNITPCIIVIVFTHQFARVMIEKVRNDACPVVTLRVCSHQRGNGGKRDSSYANATGWMPWVPSRQIRFDWVD